MTLEMLVFELPARFICDGMFLLTLDDTLSLSRELESRILACRTLKVVIIDIGHANAEYSRELTDRFLHAFPALRRREMLRLVNLQ